MTSDVPIVYVVDDDSRSRDRLAWLIRSAGHRTRVYGSAADWWKQLPPNPAGCVVLELQIGERSGLELQASLAESAHPLPIVFWTDQGDIPTAVRALRRGAEDFLTKKASNEALLEAIERALRRNALERQRRAQFHELRALFDLLKPRERQVLAHVVRGLLNKQIASDLSLSERTVKHYRTGITAKLHVHSVVELMRLVLQTELLEEALVRSQPAETSLVGARSSRVGPSLPALLACPSEHYRVTGGRQARSVTGNIEMRNLVQP